MQIANYITKPIISRLESFLPPAKFTNVTFRLKTSEIFAAVWYGKEKVKSLKSSLYQPHTAHVSVDAFAKRRITSSNLRRWEHPPPQYPHPNTHTHTVLMSVGQCHSIFLFFFFPCLKRQATMLCNRTLFSDQHARGLADGGASIFRPLTQCGCWVWKRRSIVSRTDKVLEKTKPRKIFHVMQNSLVCFLTTMRVLEIGSYLYPLWHQKGTRYLRLVTNTSSQGFVPPSTLFSSPSRHVVFFLESSCFFEEFKLKCFPLKVPFWQN